jgi:hypothetical protein
MYVTLSPQLLFSEVSSAIKGVSRDGEKYKIVLR